MHGHIFTGGNIPNYPPAQNLKKKKITTRTESCKIQCVCFSITIIHKMRAQPPSITDVVASFLIYFLVQRKTIEKNELPFRRN